MKRVVLTGNGLSVALNSDFSLKSITERFFERLDESHRDFIKHHMKEDYSQLDFEEAISSIEQVYDSLSNYNAFLEGDSGQSFLSAYTLNNKEFISHIEAIQTVIYEYTSSILDLIKDNVRKKDIEDKLQPFVDWLVETVNTSDEVDLFTLNFDLLLETILLTYYPKDQFADFHYKGKKWDAIDGDFQYYFDPVRSEMIHPINYENNVRLHHLHGSLSSFKDLETGRLFKITTESLRNNEVYDNIFEYGIIPSIVTGGGKSLKVQQNPFQFYYNEFKKSMVLEEQMCEELYIIGYSFRDEHINKAIKERCEASRRRKSPIPLKLVIVDYANKEEDKLDFLERVNTELGIPRKQHFNLESENILFGGANSINSLLVNS
jgi:hypothetical protein